MILFVDTETTGKDPSTGRLVQLAAILTEDDGTELESINVLVRPVGFEIPAAATAIHGVTTEDAQRDGIDLECALSHLNAMAALADRVVGHNVLFDLSVLDREHMRCPSVRRSLFTLSVMDTMRAMTPICRLPGRRGQFRWPRLEEAYRHAFGTDLDGAHDAMADVRACKELYFWLQGRKRKETVEV